MLLLGVVNNVFGQTDGENGEEKDGICLTLLYRPGHYDIFNDQNNTATLELVIPVRKQLC